MNEQEVAALSDQELLERRKKFKSTDIVNAVLFGVMVGIAVYSTVKNGLGLLTFFPFLIVLVTANHVKNKKAIEKECKARNL